MTTRVLIVDDDSDIRSELVQFLARYGMTCLEASCACDARKILEERHKEIDIVTVDIVMPGENGLDFAKWLINSLNLPTLIITAMDLISDKVAGLELGADDYIAKPFDPRELLARIRTVLRRCNYQNALTNSVESVDNVNGSAQQWKYEVSARRLYNPVMGLITLTEREQQLFELLLVSQGIAISKADLTLSMYNREWDPDDRVVDNLVVKLRQKVERFPNRPTLVLTERHRGYLLSSEFDVSYSHIGFTSDTGVD